VSDRSGPGTGHSFRRDAVVTVASRFVLAGLILLTDVVLARVLGADGKGRFTLVLLLSQLGAITIGLGLDRAVGYSVAQTADVARRALGNGAAWVVVVGGAGMLAALVLAVTAAIPNLGSADLVFAALALPLELAFSFGVVALLGRRLVGAYNATRLLRRGLLFVGLVSVAVAGLDLVAALVVNLLALVASVAVMLRAVARQGVAPGRPDAGLLRQQMRYGLRSWPGSLADRFQFRLDAFIVNAVVGVSATGVYSVASSAAEALWYVPSALGAVLFGRAAAAGRDAAPLASTVTRMTLALGVVVAVPAALVAPLAIEALYGPAFAEAPRALALLLPGVVAYGVVTVLSQYLLAIDAPGRSTAVRLIGLAVNVGANLALVPRMGIQGAAIASSISYTATAVLMLAVYVRATGRGVAETVLVRPGDLQRLLAGARRARAGDEAVHGV
jgi:O-antigen/teichoic acid export membrane protein